MVVSGPNSDLFILFLLTMTISRISCSFVTLVSRGFETDTQCGGGMTVWVIVEWF